MDGNQSPEVEWRPIKGWEGKYEVSSTGLVKTLPRIGVGKDGRIYRVHERLLAARATKTGYRAVGLQQPTMTKNVHRLVAETFLVREPGKDQVNHKDCDKTNNNVSNLEWCTNAENSRHAVDNGLLKDRYVLRGDEHRRRKLNSQIVREIVKRDDATRAELAKQYGVIPRTIWAIKTGRIWSDTTGIKRELG